MPNERATRPTRKIKALPAKNVTAKQARSVKGGAKQIGKPKYDSGI